MKILICEDNKLAIKTLSYVLEKEDYTTDCAEDGNIALALLKENVYDLILIDIHLPFHSGLEIIKYLRSELKMETPVIVVSAFSDPQVQRQAREMGINGYFVKPLKLTDLMTMIGKILRNET